MAKQREECLEESSIRRARKDLVEARKTLADVPEFGDFEELTISELRDSYGDAVATVENLKADLESISGWLDGICDQLELNLG